MNDANFLTSVARDPSASFASLASTQLNSSQSHPTSEKEEKPFLFKPTFKLVKSGLIVENSEADIVALLTLLIVVEKKIKMFSGFLVLRTASCPVTTFISYRSQRYRLLSIDRQYAGADWSEGPFARVKTPSKYYFFLQ